eukprot:bmy_08746T0
MTRHKRREFYVGSCCSCASLAGNQFLWEESSLQQRLVNGLIIVLGNVTRFPSCLHVTPCRSPGGPTRYRSCRFPQQEGNEEAYVQKMVKVCNDSDRWSLISLSNNSGKNVELKFVDSLRRQFEFSVDSFQIKLDSLLLFYECSENPMTETFHPTIIGESVYGDFHEAFDHLCNKIIATRNPEEIRGGGLLKYCNLLVRGFRPASDEIKTLQRYMCSRFFIDFSDIGEQQRKLESYLQNHFVGLEDRKYDYLMTLHGVVNESTVCLMGHERRQTLNLITMLAIRVLADQNVIPNVANVTCYYQPAPYVADANFSNYYIAQDDMRRGHIAVMN